jgi:hypothetical protein
VVHIGGDDRTRIVNPSKTSPNTTREANPHWGSTLDAFLQTEGIREAAHTTATTRVIATLLGRELRVELV